MTSDFSCEYKMHAPMTGCDVHITVVRKGTDAPVMKYELKEKTDGYQKSGEITVSEQIVKDVDDLVNRNLVALKSNLVPGIVTDTSDKSFKVEIHGRSHSYKSENIAKMTKDSAVEEAWTIMAKYIPAEVKQGSRLIFD
ncbi:MAG: hypothetical protein J5813_06685 [Candidatus Methanomethylophilaceae archaeon]|nr:hypothetical protein [Candidatus Methanomethylophilaceae archaeon]